MHTQADYPKRKKDLVCWTTQRCPHCTRGKADIQQACLEQPPDSIRQGTVLIACTNYASCKLHCTANYHAHVSAVLAHCPFSGHEHQGNLQGRCSSRGYKPERCRCCESLRTGTVRSQCRIQMAEFTALREVDSSTKETIQVADPVVKPLPAQHAKRRYRYTSPTENAIFNIQYGMNERMNEHIH